MSVAADQPATDPDRIREAWHSSLNEFSTVFGRLVYLSSLRDRASGSYAHYDLERLCGQSAAVLTIRESHLAAFRQWLRFSLEQQRNDLYTYISSLDSWTRLILATWAEQKPFRNLVPPCADDAERELFLADIEAVTAALKNELVLDAERLDGYISDGAASAIEAA